MNQITLTKTATGYHGIIAGEHLGFPTKQMYLDYAKSRWPELTFKIV